MSVRLLYLTFAHRAGQFTSAFDSGVPPGLLAAIAAWDQAA